MLKVVADLHVHSVLSPCAERDMEPHKIFAMARSRGIELLAITDHNSAENVHVFMNLAGDYNIKLLPGMEVQTREEVHLLTFFSDVGSLMIWQEKVYRNMLFVNNNLSIFGEQYLLNSLGNIEGKLERLLLASTSMGVKQVSQEVEKLGGICIPAHVDRPRYGILGQLGYIPSNIGIEGVEVSPLQVWNNEWRAKKIGNKFGVICSSDAHYLEDIGRGKTAFYINEINLSEIKLALRGEQGRWTEVI